MTGKGEGKLVLGTGFVSVLIAIALILMIMASCSEEVIVPQTPQLKTEKPATIIKTDTVYRFRDIIVLRDSIIMVHDTVTQVKRDTVFLTQYYVDIAFKVWVDRFYQDALAYGWDSLQRNNLMVVPLQIAEAEELGQSVISYQQDHQWWVKIHVLIRHEGLYTIIYRELGHVLLGKPYSTGDDVMNPAFISQEWDGSVSKEQLDKLFAK